MENFHDFEIYKYEVNCEIREITLYLREHHGEKTGVVIFKSIFGHQFQHTLEGNIVLAFEEYEADLFYKEFSNDIEIYQKYGLSVTSKNLEEFIDESENKKLKLIVISSSYGMSGWIICGEVTIINNK